MLNNHKIYCIYDVAHLLKSIRNNLIKYDLQVGDSKQIISWKVVSQLYKIDSTSCLILVPKLTPMHIRPHNFQIMKVSDAVQIFSSSAAFGIRTINY